MTVEHIFQTALTHHRAGQLAEAETLYRQIAAAHPGHADSLHLLGVIAMTRGSSEEAVAIISRAIALQPDITMAHMNLGVALSQLGRHDEAVASLRRAVAQNPGHADAHMNLGGALLELGRVDEAIECSRQALALHPDFAEAFTNLGNALTRKPQFAEALACYQRAVALDPRSAKFQNNLGTSLVENDRWEEAGACYRRAVELAPGFAEARSNLANVCTGTGRVEEALEHYRAALGTEPGLAGTHWNFALSLLLIGHYEEGWREYEWRWRHSGFTGRRRNFSAPQWDGTPAPGQTILVHAEQGLGDTIQFLRYVPFVRGLARAGRVIFEIPATLARLFAHACTPEFETVTRPDWSGATLPPFDQHVPLLSLPLALRAFEPVPMKEPYLRADAELRATWRARLGEHADLRVGLAWAGNPAHNADRRRSIPFEALRPLLRTLGVGFCNLQLDSPAPADAALIDLTSRIADFADTAALMAELDLIISVDTAAAHLAGALGKPVWTLLPFVPDWRWGLGREDTPWYPTMRLFRQRTAGDWDEVVQRLAAALDEKIKR